MLMPEIPMMGNITRGLYTLNADSLALGGGGGDLGSPLVGNTAVRSTGPGTGESRVRCASRLCDSRQTLSPL